MPEKIQISSQIQNFHIVRQEYQLDCPQHMDGISQSSRCSWLQAVNQTVITIYNKPALAYTGGLTQLSAGCILPKAVIFVLLYSLFISSHNLTPTQKDFMTGKAGFLRLYKIYLEALLPKQPHTSSRTWEQTKKSPPKQDPLQGKGKQTKKGLNLKT